MKSPKDQKSIVIDITNACPNQCSNCTRFCGHYKENFFMDFETFKRAVDSCKGYHGTVGLIGGEPTLHPEFERFAQYLHSQMPEQYQKAHRSLIRPQKDFIESVFLENKGNSEVYEYETGARETMAGAGLWTTMGTMYKKHYELIQDIFRLQSVNDHGGVIYHTPVLISRKDMGIPDEEWHKIRDHCCIQEAWCATITPKGAFFCDVAGALDMLLDGPGGWPIEEGWWKRTPEEFGYQLNLCEYCGMALETFTRDSRDWVDDVSESMYKKLVEIDSPKLKREGAINLVQIKDGVISEESKKGTLDVRNELYFDNYSSRFNKERSPLFPEEFEIIIDSNTFDAPDLNEWISEYGEYFSHIFVITDNHVENENPKVTLIESTDIWGHGFARALRKCKDQTPIIYMNRLYKPDTVLIDELKTCVLNPGTLMIDETEDNVTALFHKNASSLKVRGLDFISNASSFIQIKKAWDSSKVIPYSMDSIEDTSTQRIQKGKKYALYGASTTGRMAYKDVCDIGSEVVMFVDSDCNKWGQELFGKPIYSPEKLVSARSEYDLVVITSAFYQDIRNTLLQLGLTEQDFIIHE